MTALARDRTVLGLVAILVLLVAVEVVLVSFAKPESGWHGVPGYAALIGVGGCVVVIVGGKALGRLILQRPEQPHD